MMKHLSFAIIAALWLCAPASAYTKVQTSTSAAFGPQASLVCGTSGTNTTFGGPVTSGNMVWGAFVSGNSASSVFTVTDDKSNTYNVSALGTDGSGSPGMIIFWLGNITNGPSNITVTNTLNFSNLVLVCEEWSGVNASSNPSDVAPATPVIQASPGTGTNGISSTGVTTVTNGDLLLAATANRTNNTCPTSAGTISATFALTTNDVQINPPCLQLESGTQTTAGSGTVGAFTQGTNNTAVTAMLAVKAAGGGAAVIPIPVITSQPFAHP